MGLCRADRITASSDNHLCPSRSDPLDGTELSSADAAVLAKCAWVGDSRCARGDLGPKGYLVCEDISRDHRPEAVSELARLSHSTHGRIDVSSDYVVVEVAKPMANGVKTLLSVRGANGLETL